MRELGSWRMDWLVPLCVCGALLLGTSLGAQAPVGATTVGPALPRSQSGIAGWTAVGSYVQSTLSAGEGLATVSPPRHKAHQLYRGIASISSDLKAQGWAHIGDPDSVHGYVFDAYQGPSSGSSKMFLVTNPSGGGLSIGTPSCGVSCTTTPLMPSRRTPNGWLPVSGER